MYMHTQTYVHMYRQRDYTLEKGTYLATYICALTIEVILVRQREGLAGWDGVAALVTIRAGCQGYHSVHGQMHCDIVFLNLHM